MSMHISKQKFGSLWRQDAFLYYLENTNGVSAKISDYGGTLTNLYVPDKEGNYKDIVLGFDDFYSYLKGHPFLGVIVGRVANRIKNGKFKLNGKEYQLYTQNNNNHIHGGLRGFDKYIWRSSMKQEEDSVSLILQHHSPDGDENYPGTLDVTATYTLDVNNTLTLSLEAVSDQDTIVNLVNHSYFNLAGHDSGRVDQHKIKIDADQVLETDSQSIPTGKIFPVEETTLNCKETIVMGDLFQKQPNGKVDCCYVLPTDGVLRPFAKVSEEKSGRVMEVATDNVGVQFYNASALGDVQLKGKEGVAYGDCAGFCLETQHFPDTPNHSTFPSCVLKKGEVYKHTWQLRFGLLP